MEARAGLQTTLYLPLNLKSIKQFSSCHAEKIPCKILQFAHFNSNLHLTTILSFPWERYYEFHFIDKEIEVQKSCEYVLSGRLRMWIQASFSKSKVLSVPPSCPSLGKNSQEMGELHKAWI